MKIVVITGFIAATLLSIWVGNVLVIWVGNVLGLAGAILIPLILFFGCLLIGGLVNVVSNVVNSIVSSGRREGWWHSKPPEGL